MFSISVSIKCRLQTGLKCRLRPKLSHRLISDIFSMYDRRLIIMRDPNDFFHENFQQVCFILKKYCYH